jgi:DNA-binding MarR family transcriptional regulator
VSYRVSRRQVGAPHEDSTGDSTAFVIENSMAHLTAVAARLFSRALQDRIAPYGVTVGQWTLLLFLWEQDGLSQKQLSRRAQIEEPTAARTIERMERDGLVTRKRNAEDRRVFNVFLTEQGRDLRDELVPYANEINSLATHGLSDEDKQKSINLLTYMIARLV